MRWKDALEDAVIMLELHLQHGGRPDYWRFTIMCLLAV